MPRASVAVRAATPDDVPDLLRLWSEFREAGGAGARAIRASVHGVDERLTALLTDPRVRVLVATDDDDPAGMAVLSPGSLGPLSDVPSLQMSYVMVADAHRRRGVGHALVAAAAEYAEDRGVEQLLVNVPPSLRDANRFYARLGFAPVVVRRAAPVAALRRRLATPNRRALVDDLVRRRSARRLRLRPQPLVVDGEPPLAP